MARWNGLRNAVNDNLDLIQCVCDFLQPCTFDIYNWHCHPYAKTLLTAEGYLLEVQEHKELHHSLFLCQH